MRLTVHALGDGPKTALLVHGIMSSAGTWVRVAPLLVERGYRVLMPDLRGHGDSPHADAYAPELFAADLAESLPAGADLAIGHSLGGLSLSLAIDELRPARAVYSDPAWKIAATDGMTARLRAFAAMTKQFTAAQIREMNPRWSDEDVAAEVEGFSKWDPNAAAWLSATGDLIPEKASVPSLVQAAADRNLVPDPLAEDLRTKGFEVTHVPESGHCIHRDNLNGFMTSIENWL